MPDHFHGLLKLGQDYTLSEVMRDLKGRSACALNRELSLRGSRWQPAYFERALRFDESRIAIARYIIANPLRAGIVDTIGDYPYWNADYL
jgi:REP element-mobilizing transposase RayT